MVRLTKENNEKIKKYIFSIIDGENYNVTFKNDKEKLQFVYDTFVKEYGHEIERRGPLGAFSEWIKGLPSAFNVEYRNYYILELAKEWGQVVETESQQYKILDVWFDFITNKTFVLMHKYKINKFKVQE